MGTGRTQLFSPFTASPHSSDMPTDTIEVPHTKRRLQIPSPDFNSFRSFLPNFCPISKSQKPWTSQGYQKGSLRPSKPLITLTPHSAHGNGGGVFIAQRSPELVKYFTLTVCLKPAKDEVLGFSSSKLILHGAQMCVMAKNKCPQAWELVNMDWEILEKTLHITRLRNTFGLVLGIYIFFPTAFWNSRYRDTRNVYSPCHKQEMQRCRWHENTVQILLIIVV